MPETDRSTAAGRAWWTRPKGHPTRRRVLRVALVAPVWLTAGGATSAVLAGCTSGTGVTTSSPGGTSSTDADAQALGRTLTGQARLYETVTVELGRFGHQVAALRPVLAALEQQLNALQAAIGVSEGPIMTPVQPSASPRRALARTTAGLDAAATTTTARVATSVSGPAAALLASIAASDAAMAAVLRSGSDSRAAR